MSERDIIFRERLIALVGELRGEAATDKALRRRVGSFATRLVREAGANDWADLKERADGPTYDSALQLFQTQSEAAQKAGNSTDVRAFEILALSLIARRQYQADLLPGVSYIDTYIGKCERLIRSKPQLGPLAVKSV